MPLDPQPDIPPSLRSALAGRYTLDRVLGQGGMATVYLGHDPRLGRAVAIKVLRPEVAMLLGRDRFAREIRRTAALNHPNIIPIFDSGEAAGFLYYVMPVIEGETLEQRLVGERQLPLGESLQIIQQVVAGLEHAHRLGLVHRDVKPANILLAQGRAIVADFGIAIAVDDVTESRLTETGLTVGTPWYMSPEQAAGHRQVDARTDQYALACVAYEMLGGEPPFTGSTPQAVMARQITDPPPPLLTLRPDLPLGIEAALRRALSKVSGDRFPTITGFGDALRAAVEHPTPTIAITPRPAFPAARTVALAAAVTLFVAAAAWGWQRFGASRTAPLRSLAVLPPELFTTDTTERFLIAAIQEGLVTELGQNRAVRVKPRSAVTSMWDEDRPIRRVMEGLSVDGAVDVGLTPLGDSLRLTVKLVRASDLDIVWASTFEGRRSEILQLLATAATAIATHAGVADAPRPVRVPVDPEAYRLVARARQLVVLGGLATEEAHRLTLEAIQRAPDYSLAYATLARALRWKVLFSLVRPEDAQRQALAAANKAVELDSLDGEAWIALGEQRFWGEWDWAGAARAYERATELNPSLVENSFSHGTFLALTGQTDAALAEFERMYRNDPLNNNLALQLGWVNLQGSRYPEALASQRRMLANHPGQNLAVYQQQAWVYALMDSSEAAVQAIQRALPDPSNADWFDLTSAAYVYAKVGRRTEALRLLRLAYAWSERNHYPANPYEAALVHAALGDDAEALRLFAQLIREHWPSAMFLASEPLLPARLRADPRMRAIFREAGLPEWAARGVSAPPSP